MAFRWMFCKVLAVVGEACQLVLLDVIESVGERHVSVDMVMAISFAIGRDVQKLGRTTGVIEAPYNATGKVGAVVKQFVECDRTRNCTIVEK